MALTAFGSSLFGERYGTGTPDVLALHGWGRDHRDWGAVLAGLDAVAVDLPGFGASPPPARAIGSAGYAEIVATALGEIPPIVVGHSFGGRIAVQLAAWGAVDAAVLVGTPLLRSAARRRSPVGYRLVKGLHRLGVVGDGRLETAKRRYGSSDYRAASGVMRDVLVTVVGESYERELERIAVPVRLVWGADDTEVPVSVAEAALTHLAKATLTVVPGVGHLVPTDAPGVVRSAIEDAR